MYNCILIIGPTASGKSNLAIELALRYGGEIVNCDSQQIYKGFDIGTAKPTKEEFAKVKHHLFDYVNITEDYSVSRYRSDALSVFEDLQKCNKLPVFVGGTGLYINSLLYNLDYGFSPKNNDIREKYEKLLGEYGNDYVYNLLKVVDPKSASKIHPNDTKRVVRALEISETGKKKSEQVVLPNENIRPFIIYCNIEREFLYDLINKRVDIMLEEGLFEEVEMLNRKGLFDSDVKLPIGYSEWREYYAKRLSFEQTVDLIKQHSRNYAKRQKTWFRSQNFTVEYNPMHSTMHNLFEKTDQYFRKK